MKKGLALGITITLLITLCDIPVFSEPASDEYALYREYRENLLRLQKDVAVVYLELHQGKNPQAVYEHILQVIHQTAVLLGDAEAASMDIPNDLQPSLQNYMEMLLLLGLNEEKKSNLMDLGYTEEDIAKFMDWILAYNDFNHHVITGFTPEEMERFYGVGLTDAHIVELQAFINDYYASPHTAQERVNQQTGLLHIQISLSLIALKILEENIHIKNKEKETDRLQNAERKLVVAIQNISDEPSLEKVKAYSKEVYKAAEQKIRNGEHQYRVDFFVGLQIHCGSLTALIGDRECGLAQIHAYEHVVSECALSPERPEPRPVPSGEYEALVEQSSPLGDYIGLVEESNEANNMGVIVAFVKAPDTTFMQFLLLLFAGVGAEVWSNWTLPGLTVSLESLCAGSSTTISTIATGGVNRRSVGLTDDQVSELHDILDDHYNEWSTAQEVVKEHQIELMHAQVSLSVAALQTLLESTDTKEKDKDKSENRITSAEENLLNALSNLSGDQSSLEKVKAFSKHVYKAAEQEIKKGNTQYMVDFFIGLQIHCGAVTALHGDIELGLKEIQMYEDLLVECVENKELLQSIPLNESSIKESSEQSIPLTDFVGQIEEYDETNNLAVAYVLVKAPDTTVLQFLFLLSSFVFTEFGEAGWSITLPHLMDIIGTITTFTVSAVVTKIAIVAGAFLLLIVTAPSVGLEWPAAVPGWIEGDQIIIVVEGSYGQAHIPQRAESKDPCTASSHQAILDDKYMIQEIVTNALKLFYNKGTGQYIYYYLDADGKEWATFIKKWGETKYYELRTAYRVDCPPPYECKTTGQKFSTIIDKWFCEGFKLINIW